MARTWIIVSVALIFALSLLPACAEGPTPTPTPTPTPIPTGPVKLVGITPWSGPAGMSGAVADACMALVEYQVNPPPDGIGEGILGGRELDLIGCDSRSTTAGCVACARQALYEDDAVAVLWGGFTGADVNAILDFCEETGLPFFYWGSIPFDICDKKFAARNSLAINSMMTIADDTMKLLNPKTVAGLAYDTTDGQLFMNGWLEKFRAAGVEVLYEEYYSVDTIDFTPYLTRIKSLNPDLLMVIASNEGYVLMAKQMHGLGGLPDTEVMADPPAETAGAEEGAQGWYYRALWYPGLDTPGGKKLEEDYYALYKGKPISYIAYYYNCVWSAINAIELAGTTDRVKVAEATRSGNLVWEAPVGTLHFDTCGEPGHIPGRYIQIVDRKLIPVEIPE